MTGILRAWAELVVRRAWWVLAFSLGATALLAAGTARLEVNLDPEQQLPADHPYVRIDREIREEFGGSRFVAIALVPESGNVWSREVLQAVHDLTMKLLHSPGVIRQNVVSLSSPYVRVPVDEGGRLGVETLMREVPADAADVEALRDRYRSEPLFRGTVVSEDERAAMVLADFYDDAAVTDIASIVEAAVAPIRRPGLEVAVTGQPILENVEADMIRRQSAFFGGTVLAVLFVLYLAFGQIQGVVLPAATALLSTAWAMGMMGYAGIPLTSWTASVPLMVLTVAAGHSAQMLKRYYEEYQTLRDRHAAIVESTVRIGVVMMAAGFTAGCGFAALGILGVPTLMHFGLGVATGIFGAVILEMTFMLSLRAIWPTGRATGGEGVLSKALGAVLAPLEAAVSERPRRVVAVFALVAAVAAAGYPWLSIELNPRDYWPPETEIGSNLRVFDEHFPGTTTITVLLEGEPGSMKTPAAIALMKGIQDAMANDPETARTSSVVDLLERTYEVFVPEEAGKPLPLEQDLLSQLFFLSESPAFERYLDRSYSRAAVLGFLKTERSGVAARLLASLHAYAAAHPAEGIRVKIAGGAAPTLLALNEHTVKGKILNIGIVLAVIYAIASVLLRTPLGGAYVVAPLVMALVVNLGAFAWLGVAFDLGGASIAAIGVGIGADYAIYFLYRLREELRDRGEIAPALRATMETSGRAVLFVALAISAGFGVYLLADFYSFRMVGFFVPLTMITSCLTALTLLPALVLLLRPPFLFDGLRAGEAEEGELLRAAESG